MYDFFREICVIHYIVEVGEKDFENNSNSVNDIYTEIVKAGKRKYFVDVKKLRDGLYYLVITECVKKEADSVKFRIVLFPEDFSKFTSAINNAIKFIKKEMPGFDFDKFNKENITITNGNDVSNRINTIGDIDV